MNLPLAMVIALIPLFLIPTLLAIWFYSSARRAKAELDSCSDLLQEMFKLLEEPSVVARVLLQETLREELVRLKRLLESREQTLLLENTALKHVFRGLPDGLVALDVARRVVLCNTAYCRLMEISEETHQGRRLFEILRNHTALEAVEGFLQQTAEMNAEIEFTTASGKTLKLNLIRLELDSVVNVILFLTDVSKLKKLETLRRDFIANVSHELRTPLTAIQGFIETLLDGAGADTATRERFLGLMKTDSERLRRLIEDLLALSRIESQTHVIEKQSLKVASETDEILELFALRIHQKRLALDKQIDPALTLSANRDQFRQVLINLLDNAVKFSPDGGLVSVRASQDQNGKIEIRVLDSGAGVNSENREKIFQRFFREDKARSRETGGTGLGLAIVKHIMEAHRGQVRCEAGPEKRGALFVLTFPSN